MLPPPLRPLRECLPLRSTVITYSQGLSPASVPPTPRAARISPRKRELPADAPAVQIRFDCSPPSRSLGPDIADWPVTWHPLPRPLVASLSAPSMSTMMSILIQKRSTCLPRNSAMQLVGLSRLLRGAITLPRVFPLELWTPLSKRGKSYRRPRREGDVLLERSCGTTRLRWRSHPTPRPNLWARNAGEQS